MKLSVRAFVELTRRTGHLFDRVAEPVRREEGLAVHKQRQQAVVGQRLQEDVNGTTGTAVAAEVPVSGRFRIVGRTLQLSGRIDLCWDEDAFLRLEELKASRLPPLALLARDNECHWGQLETYGALLALVDGERRRFELVLRYVHPDSGAVQERMRRVHRSDVLRKLRHRLQHLAAHWGSLHRWQRRRDLALAALAFPYPQYRPQQGALIRALTAALRRNDHLLLEAATGLGKSLGVIFPLLRMLPEKPFEQLWYLTAKRTGRLTARKALTELQRAGTPLRWVELSAREQSCLNPGVPCDADYCRYAENYYERLPQALQAARQQRSLDREQLRQIALNAVVCPYALARHYAPFADVVLGDYHHGFNPGQSLPEHAAMLVDEAHQLVPRVRRMLSPELDLSALEYAIAERQELASARTLRSRWRRLLQQLRKIPPGFLDQAQVGAIYERLIELQALLQLSPPGVAGDPLWSQQWQLAHWLELQSSQAHGFQALRSEGVDDQQVRVQLLCLDPSQHIASVCRRQPVTVRFSGSLTPMPLYQLQHGLNTGGCLRIASPHPPAKLGLFIVDDLPQYWRCRESNLPATIELLLMLSQLRPGAWLIGVPSFTYLQQLAAALRAALEQAERTTVVLVQAARSSEHEREKLLQRLRAVQQDAIMLIALGGVFSESLDYTGVRLAGTVALGLGMSPPVAEREAIARHYDSQTLPGHTLAYQQPAMERIIQFVGRLLRSPDDCGVACLVDPRFLQPDYQRFFPASWQPLRCSRKDLPALLAQ